MDPHLTNEDVADILALLDSLSYDEFDLRDPALPPHPAPHPRRLDPVHPGPVRPGGRSGGARRGAGGRSVWGEGAPAPIYRGRGDPHPSGRGPERGQGGGEVGRRMR